MDTRLPSRLIAPTLRSKWTLEADRAATSALSTRRRGPPPAETIAENRAATSELTHATTAVRRARSATSVTAPSEAIPEEINVSRFTFIIEFQVVTGHQVYYLLFFSVLARENELGEGGRGAGFRSEEYYRSESRGGAGGAVGGLSPHNVSTRS